MRILEKNSQVLNHLDGYQQLEVLSISCLESLRSLPNSLGQLVNVKTLLIDNGNGCSMNPTLPESIGNLQALEKLVLFGAQDPSNAGPQPGKRPSFPESMSQLKNLTYLDLGRNELETVPPFVKDLPKVKEFRFQWNKLRSIPEFLKPLHELTTLRLEGNDLDDLPD